jgi:glycosyltransferase involved in cell wall biosynthesis/peptidoglycan/xylan/chitin deacetylase (PgdA/CDA1 family)
MRVALLSAAVQGDNAGDAFIEDSIRRLVAAEDYHRFPLLAPFQDADIEAINNCDIAIICGTNLYQHVFNCTLDIATIERIKVPIIPMGIGSSAPIGTIPRMDEAGVSAVRLLHSRCSMSSVRDPGSLRFLHSIGIRNTMLTACPVLFHGLRCPDFRPSGEGYTLSPRARLLHIDRSYEARQMEALDRLCRRYQPRLVLQSPYDLPLAEKLKEQYGVEFVMDDQWQAEPFVQEVSRQALTFGFRLHFGMLSLSYGKPAYFVAHDSRVSEFCEMMGLRYFDIRNYSDNALMLQIDSRSFGADDFRRRWDDQAREMVRFLRANGLPTRLDVNGAPPRATSAPRPARKPRVLMLVDKPKWSYDHSARQIVRHLRKDFDFDVRYLSQNPALRAERYDLLYVFCWADTYHRRIGFDPERIVKELSSHRWVDEPAWWAPTPAQLVRTYLSDAGSIICTSRRLQQAVEGLHPHVYLTPNGFDARIFYRKGPRSGPMRIGWAGNPADSVKGLEDILKPACEGRFDLRIAAGGTPHRAMNRLYNEVDVFAIASRNEGEPLTLVEAMAAGCFPVCTDVGIVPELIRSGENGLIVPQRTPEAFREAFSWCEANLEHVRAAGAENAIMMRQERRWSQLAPYFKRAFVETLERARRPKFRNDDVSGDTCLKSFRRFCQIFWKYGLTQVHGVTLHGRTNALYLYKGEATEYEGFENVGRLPNALIRELSAGVSFKDRPDLIEFLAGSRDEIALHGLYHTDYSKMTADEQRHDIDTGLRALHRLFSGKLVRYFIAPFNRTNEATYEVCREYGLTVLAADSGVHLEEQLDRLTIQPATWYRYHHHRFYPESACRFFNEMLTLEGLDAALGRNPGIAGQPRDLGLFPPMDHVGPMRRIKRLLWRGPVRSHDDPGAIRQIKRVLKSGLRRGKRWVSRIG